MDQASNGAAPQRIVVFQQNGSGENKIAGISEFGGERFVLERFNIDVPLPELIDDTARYLPEHMEADLVLDYLKHPDLSFDLSLVCKKLGIPVIASRKKIRNNWTLVPPVCCALQTRKELGSYGGMFGAPELGVEVEEGVVQQVRVTRGAPCGATWKAAEKIRGLAVEEALVRFGLETQFFCKADPAAWDVINGKSPVHLAADLHTAGLEKACCPAG